jgi:membrane protein
MVKLTQFAKEIYKIWTLERPGQQAAALAYYGMFSFAPIIFIALSVVGLFADQIAVANQFYQRLSSIFGEATATWIQESIAALGQLSTEGSILISIISFGALLFAASGVFFQLQYALNTIWHVPPPEKGFILNLVRKQLVSFVIVIGIGLFGILAIFVNVVLAYFGTFLQRLFGYSGNLPIITGLSALGLSAVTFGLLYKLLPETKVAWRDVWLGAIVAAVLVVVAINLAALYFSYSSLTSALQAAGAVSVLLMSFFYIAEIFLAGAIICRVYAYQFGSRCSISEGTQPENP